LLVDIDELRRTLDVVLDTVKQPLVLLGADMKVLSANEAFRNTFKLPDKLIGIPIFEIGEGRLNIPEYRALLEEVASKNRNLNDFDFEANFPVIGRRKMRMNARRFFEEGHGMELILIGLEDITPDGEVKV